MKTLNKIGDTLCGLAFIMVLIAGMLIGGYMDSTYPMECEVVEWGNGKALRDVKGEVWEDDRTDNFKIGDTVKVVFADNGTHTRYDDIVLKIKEIK